MHATDPACMLQGRLGAGVILIGHTRDGYLFPEQLLIHVVAPPAESTVVKGLALATWNAAAAAHAALTNTRLAAPPAAMLIVLFRRKLKQLHRLSTSLRYPNFAGLAPRRSITDLYRLRATKLRAQDLFDCLAHLSPEPESHLTGILLRAFKNQLVMD